MQQTNKDLLTIIKLQEHMIALLISRIDPVNEKPISYEWGLIFELIGKKIGFIKNKCNYDAAI